MSKSPLLSDDPPIRWRWSFFLAVALHLVIFSLIPLFFPKKDRSPVHLIQWGNPQLQKIRTVGDKKGGRWGVSRPPIILSKKAPIQSLSAPELSLEQLKSLKSRSWSRPPRIGKNFSSCGNVRWACALPFGEGIPI